MDIGAFESQGFTLTINAGDNQQVVTNTALPIPLSVRVTANNPLEPVQGGLITFTAPASGLGGDFPSPSPTDASINGSGIATAPTFTTNGIPEPLP